MRKKVQLLVLSDGKAGHESQSWGLAEAMVRRVGGEIHLLRLDLERNVLGRMGGALEAAVRFPKLDFVIAAGSATHLPLLVLAKRCGAQSVCLMRPKIPFRFYDFCVAPEHDFPEGARGRNLILSKGALNRVVAGGGVRAGRLFLIGGPSRIHGFDEEGLISQISRIAQGGGWEVADSRRTPVGFLNALRGEALDLEFHPHEETVSGWLAGRLSEVEEVWVTEDSVSMIYEALSGGARVGVLKMPRLKPSARVLRGLESLEAEGFFIGSEGGVSPVLAEAERCAALILDSVSDLS